MVQAAPDEVLDDGVGVVGRLPGDADLAGADASDGPVGDAGARVVACGRFGSQPDAVTVGDRGQPGVGLIGDVADANRVALAFAGGQPVVAPPAGFRGGGDERLVQQLVEGDLLTGSERVGGGERDPAGLGEQHLDPYVVLAGERQPQQGSVGVAGGEPGGGIRPGGLLQV